MNNPVLIFALGLLIGWLGHIYGQILVPHIKEAWDFWLWPDDIDPDDGERVSAKTPPAKTKHDFRVILPDTGDTSRPAARAAQEVAEEDSEEADRSIEGLKQNVLELQSMNSAEAAGLDLTGELDRATRAYGEAYWDRHKAAPPEWH